MDLTEGLILSSMMGDGSGSGGGNPGYHVETQTVTIIPQQSVTTVDDVGSAYGSITLTNMTEPPVSLQVVFNGTSYNCPKVEDAYTSSYGAQWDDSLNDGEGGMDWSEYPFSIGLQSSEGGGIETESAGTYTVSATAPVESLTVSDTFKQARGYSVDNGVVTASEEFTEAVQSAQLKHVVAFVENKIGDITKQQIKVTGGMIHQPLTWEEISTAYEAGLFSVKEYFVQKVYENSGSYRVVLISFSGGSAVENLFVTSSADGYPEMGGK